MRRNNRIVALLLGALMLISVGCQKQEEDLGPFEKSYVVGERESLPYFESWQQLNSSNPDDITRDLLQYDKDESYFLVDNEGKIMEDEEFARNKNRDFSDFHDFEEKVRRYPLFIVQEGSYYVTTAEKEFKALFKGERKVHGEDLEKILVDNKEAYKKKDYQAINDYLNKNRIKVWKSRLDD